VHQPSFDELGTPLSQVTFVVVDLETTGASPSECAITEVGALKLRGGELLGTFETLVNPGVPIPPTITMMTGITEAMILPAPRIDQVLPPFLEFLGDAVIVGHNVRFDVSFLDTALRARDFPALANPRVDTLSLARRLVRDEVPNLRLATLARHLRASTEPRHRAMADARATAEVFHTLLERAGTLGVLGLDDLLALPTIRAHPSVAKLALTARLPRRAGVYLFRDRGGRVLYVGKAANLRARVRSYFSGDDRRKVPQLLRETAAIDHFECAGAFEAAVRELRLIQDLQPRFNRQSKGWRSYAYLRLTDERFPRLAVSRVPLADDSCLGPFRSVGAAHVVREAIESAVEVRRCSARIGRRAVIDAGPPCVPAQLGVAVCPCRGQIGDDDYAAVVDRLRRALDREPEIVSGPLEARMQRLADDERFEEAASTRDRLAAFARAVDRRRLVAPLRAAERLVVDTPDGRLELRWGRLMLEAGPGSRPELASAPAPPAGPAGKDEIDELLLVARHLARWGSRARIVSVSGTLAAPLVRIDGYEARSRPNGRRRVVAGAPG
jgi:DNA polymerase-3 subunit epsilon